MANKKSLDTDLDKGYNKVAHGDKGFDFADGMGEDDETDTSDQEVITVRDPEPKKGSALSTPSTDKRNSKVVDRQPLVEKSAGPGNTVRRTQQQEEALSFNRGITNRPADKVIGGLDPVDETEVETTDIKGNRIKDTQHTNR